MGVLCAFWSADLQSIFRSTDLFQRAVGPGVSVLKVVARNGLRMGHLGTDGMGNTGPQRLFAPSGFPPIFFLSFSYSFFFILLHSSSPFSSSHTSTPHNPFPRNTTCITFHTVVRPGSAGPTWEQRRGASPGPQGVHSRMPQMTPA